MTKKTIITLSALALCCASYAQQGDRLLQTMKTELDANFAELQKQPVKPYFMSYRAEDAYRIVIMSSFGVLKADQEGHTRILTPQIRVGDMTLDNFKYSNQAIPQVYGRQTAQTVTLPFEDDATDGITTNIWNATLTRYRYAQAMYEQAKSKAATSAADEDKAPCFSKAPVETYYETPLPASAYNIDRKAWEQRLNAVSAVFKAEPSLTEGDISLDYNVSRTWLVNTEGTSVVQNRVTARVMLQVQAIADDGMQLPLMQDFFAFSPDSLPSQDSMIVVAKDLLKRVVALKNAPVANPYTGPAILSGPASGVFFHEIFGHRLEGHRLKQGGETFKNMVGKPVLPSAFQVYCDPTMRSYHGQDMNGFYLYDSEGVKARRVNNVVDGVLKEFLMSRVPLDSFPQSNGHGRASGANDAVSRQSNLTVETNIPMTDAQLRYELKKECKKQGKDYGYFFKTVTSGYTMTGEGNSINSFNVTPVEVYRIYVDGRPDELVRGVSLIGTPLSMFSHIKFGGDTPATFTGVCGAESGWVPVTANSPAIFVTQIETQRINKGQAVPPVLAAPAIADNVKVGDSKEADIIRQAMSDELHRSMDSLQLQGAQKPFWIDYMTNRMRTISITGEYGGISKEEVSPWMTGITGHVLLGNFRRTSDVPVQPLILGGTSTETVDYGALRRSFWQLTDNAYKNSINMMAQKENYLQQNPLPSALEKIPDMQRSLPVTYAEEEKPFDIDEQHLKGIAKELSAIFKDYPNLYNASVEVNGDELTSYRLTSENVNLTLPHSRITIRAKASFKDADRVAMSDELTLNYEAPQDIPSIDELKAQVKAFADQCEALRQCPNMPEYYKGPVMYEDEAAMQVFTANYLAPNQFFAQPAMQEAQKSLGQKLGKKIMDERITIKNLTDQTSFNGAPLFGHYAVDADGFKPASEMVVVDKGVFRMMLNRATPAQYAEKSTASARLGNNPQMSAPTVGVGTLAISADGTTAQEKMEKALIKAAKKHKLDYAYIISAPVNCTGLRLYQVDVKTGERKLMKTNQLILPTSDQMREMVAISGESIVKNQVSPYTYSVIYPKSIIIDDVELNKPVMKGQPVDPVTFPLLRK